jgi:hypothetical protein
MWRDGESPGSKWADWFLFFLLVRQIRKSIKTIIGKFVLKVIYIYVCPLVQGQGGQEVLAVEVVAEIWQGARRGR